MLLTFELERTHPQLVQTILKKYEEKHNQKTFAYARQHQSFWKNQCRDFAKAKRGRMWVPKNHYRVDEFFNQDWYNLIDGFEFRLVRLWITLRYSLRKTSTRNSFGLRRLISVESLVILSPYDLLDYSAKKTNVLRISPSAINPLI